MTYPTITDLPTAPSRNRPDTFSNEANTFLAALVTLQSEINTAGDYIDGVGTQVESDASQVDTDKTIVLDAKNAAVAAANFEGAWADLTGALNVPAAVTHSGDIWLLLNDLADVTTSEPGVSSDWQTIGYVTTAAFESRSLSAGTGLTGGGDLSQDRTFNIDKATASNLHEGTPDKVVDPAVVYSASAPVTLTDAATISLDLDTGWNFTVTLGGDRTLANPDNPTVGQSGVIIVNQDGTGGRTLSFGSNYKINGESYQPPTDANIKVALSYFVEATDSILIFPSSGIS